MRLTNSFKCFALMTMPLCALGCQHTAPTASSAVEGRSGLVVAAPAGPSTTPPKKDRYFALGQLRTRDRIITILSGPNGPAYTVRSEDGTILALHLSEQELQARFPELGGELREGIADCNLPISPDQRVVLPQAKGYFIPRVVEPLDLTPRP